MVTAESAKPRILIVEDDPGVLAMFRQAFSRKDWIVEAAASAEIALERVATEPYHAYVVDKNLPGMDGVEFIRELRKQDDRARCLMVTGYASATTAIEVANLRVDAYVEKPCNVIALRERIGTLLENSARRSDQEVRVCRFFAEGALARGEPSAGEATPLRDERMPVLIAGDSLELRKQVVDCLSIERHQLEFTDELLKVELGQPSGTEFSTVFAQIDRQLEDLAELDIGWIARARMAMPGAVFVVLSEQLSLESVKHLIDARVTAILNTRAADFSDRLETVCGLLSS